MTAAEPVLRPDAAGLASPEWGGFDHARTRGRGWVDIRRSFLTAVRLGWQMEANWTDPFLFFVYSVAKPLASALILVVMLDVISGGARPDYRAFVVVGSALWSFVLSGVSGLAWMILDDRERYRMLKYLYVSPSDFLAVIFGRGVARIGVGAMGAAITLLVGVVFLNVPFDVSRIDWILLVATMVLGVASILAIGLILAAICMQTRQESWSYPEARGRRLVPDLRRRVPAGGPAVAGPGARAADATHVVDRGHPPRPVPGRRQRDRRSRRPVHRADRIDVSDPGPDRARVAGDGSGGYTRGGGRVPGERPASEGSRAVRPDHWVLIDSDRGSRRTPRPTR